MRAPPLLLPPLLLPLQLLLTILEWQREEMCLLQCQLQQLLQQRSAAVALLGSVNPVTPPAVALVDSFNSVNLSAVAVSSWSAGS